MASLSVESMTDELKQCNVDTGEMKTKAVKRIGSLVLFLHIICT